MVYFADADAPQRQYRWCGERGGEEEGGGGLGRPAVKQARRR